MEGLAVALDHLNAPAFIVDGRGRPVYANALGTEMSESDPLRTTQELQRRITAPGPDVREIRTSSLPPHWLVVLAEREPAPTDRVVARARAWNLTSRQTDVLRLVVMGDANKIIADKLDCAEVTVEAHVTALFRKARVESRTQLVSRFWTS